MFHSSLKVSRERFNVLLCDEAEYFLESYSASWVKVQKQPTPETLHSACLDDAVQGSVKICTRGVFFVPDDTMHPVMKWPYAAMIQAPKPGAELQAVVAGSTSLTPAAMKQSAAVLERSLVFHAHQCVEMKQNNVIGKFKFVDLTDGAGASAAASPGPQRTKPGSSKAGTPEGSAKGGGGLVKSLFGGIGSMLGRGKQEGQEGSSGGGAGGGGGGGGGAKHSGKSGAAAITEDQCPLMIITLTHSSPERVTPLASQLWRLQQQAKGKIRGTEKQLLRPILEARETTPFDLGCLGDFREKPLLPQKEGILVDRVLPLLRVPGRVMITNRAVYFQPCTVNNVGESTSRWSLNELTQVVGRRYLMRSTGLEIVPRTGNPVLLACGNPKDRDVIMAAFAKAREVVEEASKQRAKPSLSGFVAPSAFLILGDDEAQHLAKPSPDLNLPPSKMPAPAHLYEYLNSLVTKWQNRELSNFEYLMELNSTADRTPNDLAQYPVFPWVLADYTSKRLDLNNPASYRDLSKPIGALNKDRLEVFQERYREMPHGTGMEAPFLYGTHYSTPGYVLYYMVRRAPEHMLRLQSGKFDAPDRLFNSMADTWKGVCTNPADLKELIPEFYDGGGDFLVNAKNLDLGTRQDGGKVGDVELPPWAYDHTDFVVQCRKALESDYVSQNLHHWIDLIFGYKQRGPAAVEANNVFHPISYQGTVDLDAVADPLEREGLQAQLAEFGQVPKQLFLVPHPARHQKHGLSNTPANVPEGVKGDKGGGDSVGGDIASDQGSSMSDVDALRPPSPRVAERSSLQGSPPRAPLSALPTQSPSRRAASSSKSASATAVPGAATVLKRRREALLYHWMEWDPLELKERPIEAVKDTPLSQTKEEEEGKEVIKYSYNGHENVLPGSGHVCCLRIHKSAIFSQSLLPVKGAKGPTPPLILFTSSHDKTVRCFDLSKGRQTKAHSNGGVVVGASCRGPGPGTWACGCADGSVKVFKASSGSFTQSVSAHSQPVSAVAMAPDGAMIATGSWDRRVKLWQVVDNEIQKDPLYEFRNHEYPITCLAWSPRGDYLVSADVSGALVFFDVFAGQRECHQTILQNTEDLGPLTNEATYGVTALAWGDAHKLQRALYPHGARHHRASTKQSLEDELISEESSIEDSEDAAATPGEYDWQGVPTGTRFNVEDWVVAATVEGKLAVFAYDGKYLGSIVTGEVIRSVALDSWGLFAFTCGSRGVVRMWDLSSILVATGHDDSFISEIELYNTPDTLLLTLPRATVASDKAGAWVKSSKQSEEGESKEEKGASRARNKKEGPVARSIQSMESMAQAAAGGGTVVEYNVDTVGTSACWLSTLTVMDDEKGTMVLVGDVEGSISVWRRQ